MLSPSPEGPRPITSLLPSQPQAVQAKATEQRPPPLHPCTGPTEAVASSEPSSPPRSEHGGRAATPITGPLFPNVLLGRLCLHVSRVPASVQTGPQTKKGGLMAEAMTPASGKGAATSTWNLTTRTGRTGRAGPPPSYPLAAPVPPGGLGGGGERVSPQHHRAGFSL